jgi:hypothetical protein
MKTFCTLVKVKVRVFPVLAVKVYRGRRGISSGTVCDQGAE